MPFQVHIECGLVPSCTNKQRKLQAENWWCAGWNYASDPLDALALGSAYVILYLELQPLPNYFN
jgi:hypothetical protein